MNTFWKILGGICVFLIILFIGLNLYFTNQRLKNTVLPYLNDAVGRPVQVESMSLSFFKTFPHPGLEIKNIYIPGKTKNDTLFSASRIVTGVELFPLFSNKVNITELVLDHPQFTYKIYADSTSNLDFWLNKPQADTTAKGYDVNIPYFEISNGQFGYRDFTTHTSAGLDDLDGDLSLNYADSISSTIDMEVGGFSAMVDSVHYVDGIPLNLTEKSIIYPDREIIRLKNGTFAIRGLKMDLSGALSNWSKAFTVDLKFNSSSDDFGQLLRLIPDKYSKYTKGLKTKGSLDLGGTVSGPVTNNATPDFNVRMNVKNGYLKNPDLSQPIENIQIAAKATNKIITVDTLNAVAGANTLTGSGTLTKPLENNGAFAIDFVAKVDLSTVHQFYDISKFDIEKLAGRLNLDANAKGTMDHPEKTGFNGKAILANGALKYKDVPKTINNININASGTQDLLTIQNLNLQAEQNSLSAKGKIRNLLDKNTRRIENMNTNLRFDLATIKDFYPVNADTLKLAGLLTAQATLDGKADKIERAVQSGSINLKNGLIDYKKFDAPFRDITLQSVLEGPQMTITEGHFKTGDNSVQAAGVINNYLSENRAVNLKTKGNAKLSEIENYYALKPDIKQLSGDADFNLSVKGPLNKPAEMDFSGALNVKKGNMSGEALHQPVKNLNGTFTLSPQKATLKKLTFNMGSSDFDVKGSLSNYMQYLKDEKKRTVTPEVSGQYSSNYLNLDELIDWSDTSSTFNLKLPDLNSKVSAKIKQLKIAGVTMNNLNAVANTTPSQINMTKAQVNLFEGKASGTMTWQIPKAKASTFHFKGSLNGLRLESFFKAYPILGEDSQFYKYITGTFNTSVDYTTKIDKALNPLIPTTALSGTFGMSKARIQNHPLQQKLVNFTKINELKDVALDKWQSSITVDNNIFTIKDLSLTSNDIGLQLNGTQNLQNENIDFHFSLLLPGRFKSKIASVITEQAAEALAQNNGTIMVPLQISGTYNNPRIEPDQTVIKPILKDYLKGKAGNVLKNLFNQGSKQQKAKKDTTSHL